MVARGLLTRTELRSKAWRQLFRDVYADSHLAMSHRTRCRAAARLLLPDGAAVAGRSAAALFGARGVDTDEPVDVLVPTGQRFGPVSGLVVHTANLGSDEIMLHDNVPVTNPQRTCWDLAQWCPIEEAVATVDQLAARGVVLLDEVAAFARRRVGLRGWRRLLRVVELADAGAESIPESRLRVRIMLAGLPRPVTQFVVTRRGRFVARVDLAWPELRVAVEYDGLWHDDPEQFHRDRRRLNRILGEDWIVLHVTAKRMRDDFDGFLAELRHALAHRAH
ncbi:endonuclease domain-containing protein [Micromonospora palythoicola]|uniref:endonuclease domain-containing protein n=1 Tax=Micromonospora palythoicola TaxID=3120507 RepID=UPI002FCE0815